MSSATSRLIRTSGLYHLNQLLIQPITGPSTGFLERDLQRNPITQVRFILFGEMSAPAKLISLCDHTMESLPTLRRHAYHQDFCR